MLAVSKKPLCGYINIRHCRLQRDEAAHFIVKTGKIHQDVKKHKRKPKVLHLMIEFQNK